MKVRIGNKLKITDPTQQILDYCNSRLVLENPEYVKKERMGMWIGDVPRSIVLFEKVGKELWLPFGCLNSIWKMYPEKDAYSVETRFVGGLPYKSNINLYSYQEKAVQKAIGQKNGILVMPCGSGKTQCGLEIIARLGGRALWLTHTHKLLNQSLQRAESCIEVPYGSYGTITDGKVEIGTHITFATVQTASKIDLSNYKDMFDIVIVDECHHCCGSPTKVTQFYKVISTLSARYKIGLTATPRRADGLHESMFALLGDIIHEVPQEEIYTCPVKVNVIETGYAPNIDVVLQSDGMIDYNKLVDDLVTNKERFDKIIDVIVNHCNKPIMVLGNRVKYLEELCNEYNKLVGNGNGVCISGKANAEMKRKNKKAIEDLNKGEISCIFATYQLAAEGLDVPNLRYVVFATPEHNETIVIQSVGRVRRTEDGKEYGVVFDFIDDFGKYRSWYKERLRFYRKIGAEVYAYE